MPRDLSNDGIPILQFKRELLGVFMRWLEESDIEEYEMIEATHDLMGEFLNEETVDFIPDDPLQDRMNENDDPECA